MQRDISRRNYTMEDDMSKSIIKLPGSLIRNDQVTIFPEGAIGYLVGPTLAVTANAVLANYFNAYMSNVLNSSSAWAWSDTRNVTMQLSC